MSLLKFLGIHTGSLPPENSQKSALPIEKPYWYIWFNPTDQNYIVQALNQFKKPTNTPLIISSLVFGLNFIEEKNSYSPPPAFPNVAALKHYKPDTTQGYAKTNIAISAKEEIYNDQATCIQEAEQQNIILNTEKSDDTLLKPHDAPKDKLNNSKALRLNKECRADFLSAISMWQQGRKGVAAVKFDSLLKKDAPFVEAHKHMFTECAIQLRKIHQNDLALAFALKCIKLSPTDSHTHFNVGRMHYELKNYKSSLIFLEDALKLEPTLAPALKLKKIGTDILNRANKHFG